MLQPDPSRSNMEESLRLVQLSGISCLAPNDMDLHEEVLYTSEIT